ncbi:MAG: TrpR-like protein, YerC/YecD [Ruminococcus sp.]|jgi:TrpR-related protein YerC/YecD|nr:TrpR-like protein, YerC/YecD [Ruminococcus sp.]
MTDTLNKEHFGFLCDAILKLESRSECEKFLTDLCTTLELKSLSQRMYVARMLTEKHVYSDIVRTSGASTATISRVNRSLQQGNGGYDTVFERLGVTRPEKKK